MDTPNRSPVEKTDFTRPGIGLGMVKGPLLLPICQTSCSTQVMSVRARSVGVRFKGSERVDGDGIGPGKVENKIEGVSGAGGRQWCSSTTGGRRDEGGAEYVGTVPAGSASGGRHPMTGEPTAGFTATGGPTATCTVTGVPVSVPRTLVTVAASAASRPATATAVTRSGGWAAPSR